MYNVEYFIIKNKDKNSKTNKIFFVSKQKWTAFWCKFIPFMCWNLILRFPYQEYEKLKNKFPQEKVIKQEAYGPHISPERQFLAIYKHEQTYHNTKQRIGSLTLKNSKYYLNIIYSLSKKNFFISCHIFFFFSYYLPLDKGMVLHLNNIESTLQKDKRPTGLNSHLSIRDFTLTSCQRESYLYINRPIIE